MVRYCHCVGAVFGLVLWFGCGTARAQVYGPDGEELPPVPQTPPAEKPSDPPLWEPAPEEPTPPPKTRTPSHTRTAPPSPGGQPVPEWQLWMQNKPWRAGLTLGGFFPVGALADASGGNVWPSIGLSYELQRPRSYRPYSVTTYLEGMAVSRNYLDNFGNRMNEVRELYGLGLEARYYMNPFPGASIYVGAGGGGYLLRRGERFDSQRSAFALFDANSLITTDYYFRPGYKLLFGFEEKHGVFLEMRFLDAGMLQGIRYSGYSLSLGARL